MERRQGVVTHCGTADGCTAQLHRQRAGARRRHQAESKLWSVSGSEMDGVGGDGLPQFPGIGSHNLRRVEWTSHVRGTSESLLRMEKNRFWEFTSRWQSWTTMQSWTTTLSFPPSTHPGEQLGKVREASAQITDCGAGLASGFSFPTTARRGQK